MYLKVFEKNNFPRLFFFKVEQTHKFLELECIQFTMENNGNTMVNHTNRVESINIDKCEKKICTWKEKNNSYPKFRFRSWFFAHVPSIQYTYTVCMPEIDRHIFFGAQPTEVTLPPPLPLPMQPENRCQNHRPPWDLDFWGVPRAPQNVLQKVIEKVMPKEPKSLPKLSQNAAKKAPKMVPRSGPTKKLQK